MVRGVFVPFSASTINSYYGLMNVTKVEYKTYLEYIDYQKVIESLTLGGGEWDITNMRHKSFDAKELINNSRIWKYFLFSKLMPNMHYSTIGKEKALLFFTIQTFKSIDVGGNYESKDKVVGE